MKKPGRKKPKKKAGGVRFTPETNTEDGTSRGVRDNEYWNPKDSDSSSNDGSDDGSSSDGGGPPSEVVGTGGAAAGEDAKAPKAPLFPSVPMPPAIAGRQQGSRPPARRRRRRRGPVEEDTSGFVVRQMPPDGSCLFHCLSYIFREKDRDGQQVMRGLVSQYITNHADALAAELGEDFVLIYPQQVLMTDVWGGGVDLALFARMFRSEIIVFDAGTGKPSTFCPPPDDAAGGPRPRAFLLYEGSNHYDLLAWVPTHAALKADEQLLFRSDDLDAANAARAAVAGICGREPDFSGGADFEVRSPPAESKRRQKEEEAIPPMPPPPGRIRSREESKELAAAGLSLFRQASA